MVSFVLSCAASSATSSAASSVTTQRSDSEPAAILAPGWEELTFPAPVPGTYELPSLGMAADGAVLDRAGKKLQLDSLFGDRVVLLAFVYRACPDPNGCPLANFVLSQVRHALSAQPSLYEHTRLVSLSIDPVRDTPAAMDTLGKSLGREPVDWRFLTTRSVKELDPILASWNQSVVRDVDRNGEPRGTLSHILRVFLVDRDQRIRNIYTSSYLHADTVLADIRSLHIEAQADSEARASTDSIRPSIPVGTPDPSLGLPALPSLEEPKPAAVALGRKLFFDRRLSFNDTISCAICHVPSQGFTSNEVATSVGIQGRVVRRNAPTVLNVGHLARLFVDGREDRLEQQVWGPLLAREEMGNPSVGFVLSKIRGLSDYDGRFEKAFGDTGLTMETLGAALASYERTLEAGGSPFDRWRFAGDEQAVSDAVKRGFALFSGRAGCTNCHTVNDEHALFTDQDFHNTGVGYLQTTVGGGPLAQIEPAAGVVVDVDPAAVPRTPQIDLGLSEITGDPADRWKFRTPGLRNVALTAPYMHDGSIADLEGVVRFYVAGGAANPGLDERLAALDIGEPELVDLVAFLKSLTSSAVDSLVRVAENEPIGNR
ncbi:MAG: cytochrome c peroxidase [Candidatus Binatia bacterium]